jgi:hypothetical protein
VSQPTVDAAAELADEAPESGLRRHRLAAAIVVVAVVALVIWLVARGNGGTTAVPARAVSQAQLIETAQQLGHPLFWLGPRSGTTYEFQQAKDGTLYVRYLPAGVPVGAQAAYTTVATYPFGGAYAALKTVAKQTGTVPVPIVGGGIAEPVRPSATSVHAAYPGLDYQVEVFTPTPGGAAKLVESGRLIALGAAAGPGAPPRAPAEATSPAKLKALATELGHPVYWVGPRTSTTYELVTTSDGQVLIRYLPRGTQLGAAGPFLTVGTYAYPDALAAVKSLASRRGTTSFKLPGGGLAVTEDDRPENVHLAYPGADYQIEVFAPQAGAARALVESGKLQPVG